MSCWIKSLAFFVTVVLIVALLSFSPQLALSQIRAVGSSTVYPFVTVISETFGRQTDFKSPIVESTGTGGGFKLFCLGAGDDSPDLSNASRAIKQSERDLCRNNGVSAITEITLGYDGIVLANATLSEVLTIDRIDLFKALARQVPIDGTLVDNPYHLWSDVNTALPSKKIEIYGPPPTSGTRDAFVELVMEPVCQSLPEFKVAYSDKKQRKKACHVVREDGHFIEVGENDNLIVQKLNGNNDAYGIFGFSFLDQNGGSIQGALIDGVTPTFENISSGDYPVSRPLYVYVKDTRIGKTNGLREFVKELVSDSAIGEDGYLVDKGLIPMNSSELDALRQRVEPIL